jgi:flagellum-specific ATP synthase
MNHPFLAYVAALSPARRIGYVRNVVPGHLESEGPLTAIGDLCEIEQDEFESAPALAEVAAINDGRVVLTLLDQSTRIRPHARVIVQPAKARAPVGDGFSGRAVGATGAPIDGGGPILASASAPLAGKVAPPLERCDPDEVLETGLRAIDGLTPLGRGQRIGVFSASGVGKTTFVRRIAADAQSDRCILCLVGERGREVENTWRLLAQRADLARFTLVAATSDLSPALRVRAVDQALCLGEYWRARGESVLLVIDSITRYAMALREIGLAAGLPATARAYTPNVFAALPRVVERCGALTQGGAITAIMSVLSETDDVDDPITETMKSLLDGHIVLSRRLSEQGHFPAIDPLRSLSRLAPSLMSREQAKASRRLIALLSTYEDARILIESGLYKRGGDAALDAAVDARSALNAFARQEPDERSTLAATVSHMLRIEAAYG